MITLVSCLSIILVSVYGKEVEEKFAISTQSFNRPDIPISFKFTNVHNSKREVKPIREHNGHRKLESDQKRYPVIQYAPLIYETKPEDHQEQQNKLKSQEAKPEPASVNTGLHLYTGQEKPKYNHLEPKPLEEDDNVNQKNYRSFISGHNVEAYPETTAHYLEQGVDPFLTHQDYILIQKVKPPKFVYYQRTKDNIVVNTPKLHNIIEEAPTGGNFKFLEFLPADFSSARKQHKKSLPYAYSLHDQLSKEKQQQTYAHPRIHLNIARSYNIAKQPQEARLPPILVPKAQALTNLLFNPQNTVMLPMGKDNSALGL